MRPRRLEDVFKICLQGVFKTCLQDVEVEVTFEGLNHIFYGTVSMVIPHNLAAHALAGFYCNFTTVNRFCPFCNITKAELQEGKKITLFTLRTNTSYDNNVKEIEQLPHLSSVYGIKANSCLNSLSYLHHSHKKQIVWKHGLSS